MREISLECPKCGGRNNIVAFDVPDTQIVTCSHCRAVIGNWEELTRQRSAEGGDPERKHSA